jgi:hypothetical protein
MQFKRSPQLVARSKNSRLSSRRAIAKTVPACKSYHHMKVKKKKEKTFPHHVKEKFLCISIYTLTAHTTDKKHLQVL